MLTDGEFASYRREKKLEPEKGRPVRSRVSDVVQPFRISHVEPGGSLEMDQIKGGLGRQKKIITLRVSVRERI